MTEKKLLRQQIKDAVSRLSPQEKAETSVIIEKRIESLPLFAEARTILLFYSLPDEVNTHEWIAHWNGKKRILLPVVKGETLIIRPYSPGEMKPGSFGTCRTRKSGRDGQNGKISVIFAPLKKYAPDVLSASDGS